MCETTPDFLRRLGLTLQTVLRPCIKGLDGFQNSSTSRRAETVYNSTELVSIYG